MSSSLLRQTYSIVIHEISIKSQAYRLTVSNKLVNWPDQKSRLCNSHMTHVRS